MDVFFVTWRLNLRWSSFSVDNRGCRLFCEVKKRMTVWDWSVSPFTREVLHAATAKRNGFWHDRQLVFVFSNKRSQSGSLLCQRNRVSVRVVLFAFSAFWHVFFYQNMPEITPNETNSCKKPNPLNKVTYFCLENTTSPTLSPLLSVISSVYTKSLWNSIGSLVLLRY